MNVYSGLQGLKEKRAGTSRIKDQVLATTEAALGEESGSLLGSWDGCNRDRVCRIRKKEGEVQNEKVRGQVERSKKRGLQATVFWASMAVPVPTGGCSTVESWRA
eukprot:TRINITY_DN14777_c0_g1_i1.p1 TRINITY_DN14777_c0_g1~~TRINITY_DN14777_c0_g1_i1.p1  ORF type:complete len:105 (+),score=18.33 TRINITY_DN14777_c0_g1_i1:224-538(+)